MWVLKHTSRRAIGRLAAVAISIGLLAACAGQAPSPSSGPASGKATIIVGRAIKMPGFDEYRRERDDPSRTVEHNITAPIFDIRFELRRFDPVTLKALNSGFLGSAGANDIRVNIDVRDAFIQEFDTTEAVARGILSLGMSAAFKFDLDTTRYGAYEVDAGHWTFAKFTTNIVTPPINHVTHHLLISKDGRLRPGSMALEVKPGEVVYIGDLTLQVPMRRSDFGSKSFYSVDPWKMRVEFDRTAMLTGLDGAERYPEILDRPFATVR